MPPMSVQFMGSSRCAHMDYAGITGINGLPRLRIWILGNQPGYNLERDVTRRMIKAMELDPSRPLVTQIAHHFEKENKEMALKLVLELLHSGYSEK